RFHRLFREWRVIQVHVIPPAPFMETDRERCLSRARMQRVAEAAGPGRAWTEPPLRDRSDRNRLQAPVAECGQSSSCRNRSGCPRVERLPGAGQIGDNIRKGVGCRLFGASVPCHTRTVFMTLSASYPVLPLRDIVVFPHMIVPLFVGREKSVRALEAVMREDKQILLASQKDASEDEPHVEGIYRAGVLATVLQLLKLPDGTVKVLVEGKMRVRITEFL